MLEQLRRIVWKIPKGKVATYGQVASAAGYQGAARQVAWALHNAEGGIPWHRVVGAGGHIRLPGSAGWEQRSRLESEGVAFRGSRIDMAKHAFDFTKTPKTVKSAKAAKAAKKRSGRSHNRSGSAALT
jgi:methylated-DNA-protein-cysteine methyltransferase related protein